MNLKSYFDVELRTTLVYAVVGAVMGYVSFVINHTIYAAFAALAVLLGVTAVMQFAWKIKEDYKWWLGNGGLIYVFVWFVVWTLLYNVYVV